MLAGKEIAGALKVGSLQLEIVRDNKKKNLENALRFLDKAAKNDLKIVCLSEYCMTGPPMKNQSEKSINEMAETIPGAITDALGRKANEHEMYIVAGSMIEKKDEKLYNTSALIDPNGKVVGKYSKTHPENYVTKYEVGSGITPGDEYPVFETPFAKIAMMIDMDGAVPEVPRILSINGAEIIFWPIQWSMRWAPLISRISCAHAYMTQSYIVASNRVGTRAAQGGYYPLIYGGGSAIADPEGNILSTASWHYQGIAMAEISIEFLRKWRRELIPRDYPLSRRPETYDAITKK